MAVQYNNDSIKALEYVEAIRLKPASIGISDHNHTLIEILANSIDESREGYGKIIKVVKFKDNSITIQDSGRGVPMDKNSEGKYAYDLAMNRLWAGGKYDNNEEVANYQYSLGTNGVGMTGVNYTSDFFIVVSKRDGYEYTIRYTKGMVQGELQKVKANDGYTGTLVYYRPSKEVFNDNDIPLSFIQETLKLQSIVNKGLMFELYDEKNSTSHKYFYANGVIDYINELGNGKNFTPIKTFETESKGRESEDSKEYKVKLEVYFCFNNNISHTQFFHNSSWLENGGTPEIASLNAFTSAIDKYLKDKGKYSKTEKKITNSDVLDSLILITNTYSTISLYDDQAKKSIKSKFMHNLMTNLIKERLEVLFIEDGAFAEKVCNQILVNKRAREKSEAIRTDTKKKLEEKVTIANRPAKYVTCRSTDKSKKELILIEGDSALNSVKLSRDAEFQGVFPLKGKPMNTLKKGIKEIIDNDEITNIFQLLNCGMEYNGKPIKNIKPFNIQDLEFDKIIAFTDEDEDGLHIRSLLICMFWVLARDIIKKGKFYILDSPLYKIETKGKTYLAYSEGERNKIMKELEKKKIKGKDTRFKGLGGLNVNLLSETAMHKDNRMLTQITVNDVEKAKQVLEMFLDDDSRDRKEYIEQYGDKYFDFSIYEV